MAREATATVRVSAAELAAWHGKARAAGVPLSELLRRAMAHVVGNRVEAAYARSDLFERRRVLMDDWARYLAQGSGENLEPLE